MFNPQSDQPLNVFYDFRMGGLEKNYTPDPHIPVECTVRMKEIIEFQLTFYDETGFEVEPYLWMAAKDNPSGIPKGSLKWGFTQPDKASPEYPLEAASYSVKFRKNAFALNLHGTLSMGPLLSTNQVHGTVKEICEKIAEMHELDLDINPKFDPTKMMDAGYIDIDETQSRELRHCKLAHENDWRYLQRVLEYALDQEGKGNYRAFITYGNSGSKPLLKIYRPNESNVDLTYDLSDPESTVIEFDPDVNFANVYGAFDSQFNGYQRLTGDTCKGVYQPQLTKDYQVTFGKDTYPMVKASPVQGDASNIIQFNSETIEDCVKSHAMRSRTGGSAGTMNRSLNQHLREAAGLYTARLQVIGDPTIKPPLNVEMKVFYPINYRNKFGKAEHYTSGIYMCNEVHHEIRLGSYVTTLYLERAGSDLAQAPSE